MDCLRLTIQADTIIIRMIKTALHITKMKEHDQERNQERRKKKSPAASHITDQVPKNKHSTLVNFYSEMMQLQVKMVVVVIIINISTPCVYVHSMYVSKSTIECLWRSEDSLKESPISFQLYVASRDPTPVAGLSDKYLCPLG